MREMGLPSIWTTAPSGWATAKRQLRQQVEQVLAGHNGWRGAAHVVRTSVPVPAVHPLAWLQAQPGTAKFYWDGRADARCIAAVGVADVCTGTHADAYEALTAHLAPILATHETDARYYGGLRFDATQPADADWQPYGSYRFTLPRFELVREGDTATLTCTLLLPRDRQQPASILAALDALDGAAETLSGKRALPTNRSDAPDAAGWERNIAWALDAFARTRLGKVVLARKATFDFPEPLDPFLLLDQLQPATPNCFHFLFQATDGTAFIGATPERLFRREGQTIRSEAVAGTRPRGDSDHADARLREELLLSEKDQREHEYVRQSIKEALNPLCRHLQVDTEASVMRLARGRHLVSRIEGTLHDDVTSVDLLQAMHPTPAVGGYPTPEAMDAIAGLEPFDRGWYAGPVGWIGRNAAEFAVAIRSGLVQQQQLALFSGAGIVRGSVAASEWAEIEHKISDFLSVLGLDLRRAK